MINRRIIRVKAMQALYGYFTAEEAIQENTREKLRKELSLDPAKHDFSDKPIFEARKKQAIKLFDGYIETSTYDTTGLETEVLEALRKITHEYTSEVIREQNRRKKEIISESRHINNLYYKLLTFPVYLERNEIFEEERLKSARIKQEAKKFPFINHSITNFLKESEEIKYALENPKRAWDNELDEIKLWYKENIRNNESLQTYFSLEESPENPNDLILDFFKKVCFKNEAILSYFEKIDLYWEENKPILKSMVTKTIKTLTNGNAFEVSELSKNGEEDFEFLEMLYSEVIKSNKQWDELIRSKVKNWEIERVSIIDRIILKLAIVEMIYSSSIPLKVTINEAIEISKQYSTPKSKQFINGILDVISNELTSSGKVRKSGRGLIDNK